MKFIKNSPQKASKTFDFDVTKSYQTKDASGDCFIEGYANTKTKDRVGDVVLPTAFDATLPIYMTNPVMLENHNWDCAAGSVVEARTDDNGLWVRARVSDARQDLKTMCRERTLRTFSIGYNEVLTDYDEPTKTKIIKELELLEISIVTVPANSEALFDISGSEAAPKPEDAQPEADADAEKRAPKSKSAKELKDFLDDVKSVVERELSTNEVEACCNYFLSNEVTMKKSELIALLKKATLEAKSAGKAADAAAGAVPAPAAAGNGSAGQTDPAGHQQDPMSQVMEALKQIAAKQDAIAQACAQILEGSKDDSEKPEGDKPAEGEKPAEDEGKAKPAADAKPADGEKPGDSQDDSEDDSDEDDKEASDEDMEKALTEIEEIEKELGVVEA